MVLLVAGTKRRSSEDGKAEKAEKEEAEKMEAEPPGAAA